MAKTVLLLRHAKSSWADPFLEDFDRPLNKRGQKAAPRMGTYLRKQGLVPDLALCSAAQRAVETWALAGAALSKSDSPQVTTRHLRSLYLAPPSRILSVLQRLSDDVQSVIVIGHNPGTEHLAQRLAGPGSDAKALDRLELKYPTAGLAELRFQVARWSEVAPGGGKLVRFVIPKDL